MSENPTITFTPDMIENVREALAEMRSQVFAVLREANVSEEQFAVIAAATFAPMRLLDPVPPLSSPSRAALDLGRDVADELRTRKDRP